MEDQEAVYEEDDSERSSASEHSKSSEDPGDLLPVIFQARRRGKKFGDSNLGENLTETVYRYSHLYVPKNN
jgi:hypothetical protein